MVSLRRRPQVEIEVMEDDSPTVSHVFTQEEADKSVQLFYIYWIKTFEDGVDNDKIRAALEKVKIQFTEERIHIDSGFYMDGTPLPPEGADVLGVCHSKEFIQVWIRDKESYKIGNTSFTHELVHLVLKVKYNTFDPDHLGKKYKAWTKKHTEFIKTFNARLLLVSL